MEDAVAAEEDVHLLVARQVQARRLEVELIDDADHVAARLQGFDVAPRLGGDGDEAGHVPGGIIDELRGRNDRQADGHRLQLRAPEYQQSFVYTVEPGDRVEA